MHLHQGHLPRQLLANRRSNLQQQTYKINLDLRPSAHTSL
jgi:hypothetical protein